jgi:hypothetical protein
MNYFDEDNRYPDLDSKLRTPSYKPGALVAAA